MQAPGAKPKAELKNIKKIGLRFCGEDVSGNSYTSKTEDAPVWLLVPAAPVDDDEIDDSLHLFISAQKQDGPDHWVLFVAKLGGAGDVYQVLGDNPGMYYNTKENVRVGLSRSFLGHTEICALDTNSHQRLATTCAGVPVPKAERFHESNANCQDWVCWVLKVAENASIIPVGSEEKGLKLLGRPLRYNLK